MPDLPEPSDGTSISTAPSPEAQLGSTTGTGAPAPSDRNSLTVGPDGPILLHDVHFLEQMAHFNREKVPERKPHAKGAGAFGVFETTEDVSAYTKAALFQTGATTEMLARFSTVAGEQGSPDTWRDVRGFSLKFYTAEGNYDLVGNNTPVFFVRDPMKFPHFIRSQKRLPDSGLRDNHMQWDFWTLNPESHCMLLSRRPGAAAALLRADEVRELHGVADEEDRGVVADEVVVALGRVELQREAARVAPRVGRALLAGDRREAGEHLGRRARLEQRGLGVRRDVLGGLELPERARALRVHVALRDALAVEVRHLVQEVHVVQQDRAVRTDGQRVAVAGRGRAGVGRRAELRLVRGSGGDRGAVVGLGQVGHGGSSGSHASGAGRLRAPARSACPARPAPHVPIRVAPELSG